MGLRLPLRHRDGPGIQMDLNWARHGVDLPPRAGDPVAGHRRVPHQLRGQDPAHRPVPVPHPAGHRGRYGDLVERLVPSADAVLVGHTHFDHAIDVGTLARRHGCPVYGSTSAAHLLGLHGIADQAVDVEPQRLYAIGPFTVRLTPSRHPKLVLGLKVPSDGELTCDALDDLVAGRYRCGQVWGIAIEVAGITLYHQGSADLVADEVRDRGVDVFLCGIAGRAYTRLFVPRILAALDPKLILAHHHDDFFRPVEGDMGFSLDVNLGAFADDIAAAAPGLPVRTLEPLQMVSAEMTTMGSSSTRSTAGQPVRLRGDLIVGMDNGTGRVADPGWASAVMSVMSAICAHITFRATDR